MLSNYVQKIKEYWQNLQSGTKKVILTVVPATIIIAVLAVAALGYIGNSNYSVLFSGLSTDEAQEVVSLLQEDGVTYRYKSNGDIMVPAEQEDQIRANLLYDGFRMDSGFTYDMYINNTGLMTTESDKKQYTLYELQDRLAAQISLFSGVSDAKVTIVQAEDKLYALSSYDGTEASASVVVTMKKGYELTDKHASAIKTLVEHAVKGMTFTNVAVIDADTMLEVGTGSSTGTYGEGESMLALTTLVETNIANNIRRVLEQLYDSDKIAISVKGTLNMEKLIQENITYSVPNQADEEDRSGLLYSETKTNEASGSASFTSGVAGSESNADIPTYSVEDEDGNTANTYVNNSATREWLYNTLTEQREVSPGVLENATVAVVINTENKNVKEDDLLKLVANAAGISLDNAENQITIVRSMGDMTTTENNGAVNVGGTVVQQSIPWLLILAVAAGVLLIVLLLALVLLRKKSSDKTGEDEFGLDSTPTDPFANVEGEEAEASGAAAFDVASSPEARRLVEETSEMNKNEEIINLRMQRSLKLKQNIGEFVDQNPQVAAKLLQGWLRGEGAENGGKQQQGEN